MHASCRVIMHLWEMVVLLLFITLCKVHECE